MRFGLSNHAIVSSLSTHPFEAVHTIATPTSTPTSTPISSVCNSSTTCGRKFFLIRFMEGKALIDWTNFFTHLVENGMPSLELPLPNE